MQQNKGRDNITVLQEVAQDPSMIVDSLSTVLSAFKAEELLGRLDKLKSKGFRMSSLLTSMLLMPFIGHASIYSMLKFGLPPKESQAKKDAYYAAINSEDVNWRRILLQFAKRFKKLVAGDAPEAGESPTAIVFDDTQLPKTGRKIERISMTYDHVSNRFVLGFRLLVCCFWDGASLIPLDFSLHRERGTKSEKLVSAYKGSLRHLHQAKEQVAVQQQRLSVKAAAAAKHSGEFAKKATKGNQKRYEQSAKSLEASEQKMEELQKSLAEAAAAEATAKQGLRRFYRTGSVFGLSKKERDEQFKKAVSTDSHGYTRRKETDLSRTEMVEKMLLRVVKNGFVPKYVLTDSWFFSSGLLKCVKSVKKGSINLISMVKINNQIFSLPGKRGEMNVKNILKHNLGKQVRCKSKHASYIKVRCDYGGTALNLFYVRMGKSDNWHLLATTDLSLNFIAVLEIYQIRWGIEVFFKESKQYLDLGGCMSSNFDAQIATVSLAMVRYAMLSYCKRINYQSSLGDLFKSLQKERLCHNLLEQLLDILWKLVALFCGSRGFDFLTVQNDMMRDPLLQRELSALVGGLKVNNAA